MDIIKEGSPEARAVLEEERLIGDGNESTTTH